MYPPPFVLQFELVALILNPLEFMSIASLVDSAFEALAKSRKSAALYGLLEVS
jgi:hypothetical protein